MRSTLLRFLKGLFIAFVLAAQPICAQADDDEPLPQDLTEIGLQALMNLDLNITTATRRSQKVSSVPAAVYVITSEEIRRAGVRHVAEALRLAPGVEVARINSSTWAVSIRGFNQQFSGQILVLVDGKSVFTPLFSGTFWETLDLHLDSIDRIEVIRGPGASVWGANAVNGVINIITKSADDTQGQTVAVGGGSHERYFHSIRQGGKMSDATTYRLTHQLTTRTSNKLQGGGNAEDDWDIASASYRSDTDLSPGEQLTFLADGYYQEEYIPVLIPSLQEPYIDGETYSAQGYNSGGSFGTRYRQELTEKRAVQMNFDYIIEERRGKILPLTRHSANVEALYEDAFTDTLGFVGGLGYRLHNDDTDGNFAEDLVPPSRTLHLYNGFVQFQQTFLDEKLRLLFGTKLEENDLSGFEAMPTVRLLANPSHSTAIWTAYSRAASTPGRVFEDLRLPLQVIPGGGTQPNVVVTALGGDDIESTILDAYEAGVKKQISSDIFIDLTAYYFDFHDVFGFEPRAPMVGSLATIATEQVLVPFVFDNGYDATSYGSEASIDYAVNESLSVSSFYSFFSSDVTGGPNSLESEKVLKEGNSPEHTVGFRVRSRPWGKLELDPTLRYVDNLKYGQIPGYWEADLRLGYALSKSWELNIVGNNLLHSSHRENEGTIFSPGATRIERGVWAELKVIF